MTLDKFTQIRGKKVVLYLDVISGDYSHVLENSGLNIIGIMTRYATKENDFYGLPHLTFSEVVEAGTEAIVITTEPIYYEIISDRLEGFCKKNGIDLFTDEGIQLQLNFPEQRYDVPLFCYNKEECLQKIDTAELIVFDFLNVLFTYKFLWEEDIQLLRKRLMKESNHSELWIQEQLLIERYDMVELLSYAIEREKKVVVNNNTGLANELIEELLNEIGIVKFTFLSQIGKKITTRALVFTCLDYQNVECEVVRIFSVYEMLLYSEFKERIQEDTDMYSRIKVGLFASKAFNSPFALAATGDGRIRVSDDFDIGYLFCAEYVTDFMIWVINKLREDNIDCVLFGARDGYLIHKLYKNTQKYYKDFSLPKSIYLWISRMVSINMGIWEKKDIQKIVEMYFVGCKRKMLTNRFFLKDEELLQCDLGHNDVEYIMAHGQKIIMRSKGLRKRYEKYISSLMLAEDTQLAYFDFAASGTCQLFLQEILDKHLHGYYFYRFDSGDQRKKDLDIKSMIDQDKSFETNSLFMECVLTAPHATVIDIDEECNPIYMKESRTAQEIEYSLSMQNAIEEYYQEVLKFVDVFENIQIRKPKVNSFCKYIYDKYTYIDNRVFSNYTVKDEFVNLESQVGQLYVH